MASSKKSNKEEKLIGIARKRFAQASDAEAMIRKNALDDLKFRAGEQWPQQVKLDRDNDGRPCLTINRMPQFIRQITNDQRQNRPSIKVSPVDDRADKDTAQVYQGIIRHIEYNSNADVAYDTAFEGAAIKGIGYFRILTEYADPLSFDQEIKIKRIRDSFSVYMDPSYTEPDGSDAEWCFVFETLSRDEFEEMYPDAELSGMQEWTSLGDASEGWVEEKGVRVAEYFYREMEDKFILKLSNGETILEDNAPEEFPEGVEVIARRKTKIPIIKWCKTNGIEILEETIWPGDWIPVIPVLGDELFVDGERILEGAIRHAKDPQRMYNYWASSETETIALAPRAPFIGVEGQFEGHEHKWKESNRRNHAFLEYKPKSVGGAPAPPPQRNVFEPPVQAITQARMLASDDMKGTIGIYDAALGNRSNETTGIAIQRRNVQSQTSNFHFIDNLTRSLKHAGRILVDLIPKIYDVPRSIRIIGEEGKEEIVKINQVFMDAKTQEEKAYDLGHGKYDVSISVGPSFATKRQEAVDAMLAITQSYPQIAQIAGDLMVKNMDWPGAEEISERLKKTLPPGLAEEEGEVKVPPQAQAQIQQMSQMLEQLTQQLNEANETIDKDKLKYEHEERMKMKELEVKLEIERAKVDSAESRELLRQEIAQINAKQAQMDQFLNGSGQGELAESEMNQNPIGGDLPS